MPSPTLTSTFLLQGLADAGNQTVWGQYVSRYRPLIVAYAERLGVRHADAEDVAQEALITFAGQYRAGRYDRSRGRLRSWLFGIARTTLKNLKRRQLRQRQGVADQDTAWQGQLADRDRLGDLWEDEWRKAIVRTALAAVREQVEPKTFRAFELFALQARPAQQVAEELEMSANAVFVAKHRVLAKMRLLRAQLEEDW